MAHIHGLSLFFFWYLAFALDGFLRNLFLLSGPQIAVVSFMTVATAWTVAHAVRSLFLLTPRAVQLSLWGDQRIPHRVGTSGEHSFRRHLRYAVLTVPTLSVICVLSAADQAGELPVPAAAAVNALWALGGAAALFLMRRAIVPVDKTAAQKPSYTVPIEAPSAAPRWWIFAQRWPWIDDLIEWVAPRFMGKPGEKGPGLATVGAWQDQRSAQNVRWNLVVFSLGTTVLYLLSFYFLRPASQLPFADRVPALFYVLMLMIVLTWMLSLLSYLLDPHRIPAEVVLAMLTILFYASFKIEHYYEVKEPCPPGEQCNCDGKTAGAVPPPSYVRAWAERHSHPKNAVFVTASGGGITAAHWTAVVLSGLQEETKPNGELGRSMFLLSGTSGGAVGTMYYADGFLSDHTLPDPKRVMEAAGHSSLGATAWGLVYPDFIRATPFALLFEFVLPQTLDRGWALEKAWERQLGDGEATTLAGWTAETNDGWRPAIIFNTVMSESGQRLSISTLRLPHVVSDTRPRYTESFDRLYPGGSIRIATAARLSATFPYVTPISHPSLQHCKDWATWGVADGGYSDNLGLMSALGVAHQVVGELKQAGVKRIVLIEIQASDPVGKATPNGHPWTDEFVGPIRTLLSVRTQLELERNQEVVDRSIATLTNDGIEVEQAVFTLTEKSPLSWHLSEAEKAVIRRHWTTKQEQVDKVSKALAP